MASKRKHSAAVQVEEDLVDPSDELLFNCLGGGNEVGRSCHVIQYKGKTVMLDAGQHPAYDGLNALPYFDDFDLSTVDILLISHFHLDHASALPYVLAKTNFRGRVFMTHPTKAIYKWLIQDSVRVQNLSSSSDQRTALYTEADHLATFPQIEAVDYYTTRSVASIRFTPYPAGHVLGAAMYLIEIAGLKILFTGDYSRENDRHLISAEIPKNVKIDVLITESTYGIASHVPRTERETAMMKSVTNILNRGGRVLMPVFALGRAQELLLILDDYWARHPEYQKIPIYYASNLARKCMIVYQTYISAMNDNIKQKFRERMAQIETAGQIGEDGPWDFRFIRSLRNLERFDDVGGCVMLASPGMLQSGVSRELLERWAPSEKNGVIITGYSVEGTMAKHIMNEPEQIPAIMGSRAPVGVGKRGLLGTADSDKPMIPRRCSIQEYSFAAHVDGHENSSFIEEVGAPVVILVHGEKHNMMRLKSKLLSLNHEKDSKRKIYSPANTEKLRIPFKVEKIAKVVGELAEMPPPSEINEERMLSGVLVQNDFSMTIMSPQDLREHAGLTTTTVMCKQRLTLHSAGIDLIIWSLSSMFGAIEPIVVTKHGAEASNGKKHDSEYRDAEKTIGTIEPSVDQDADEEIQRQGPISYLIMGCVMLRYQARGEITLEWEGNMLNDGMADAVMACLLSVESHPAAVRESSRLSSHRHSQDQGCTSSHANLTSQQRFERLCMFLEAQFGPQIKPILTPKLSDLDKSIKQEQKALNKTTISSASDAKNTTKIKTELPTDDAAAVKEDPAKDDEELTADDLQEIEAEELQRLHDLGIPVPGVEIRVDKSVAKVWLETLEIECASAVLRDRVKAVVERAVETIAPLWASRIRA